MPENYNDRVLVRTNARQLSAEEFQEIMEKGKDEKTKSAGCKALIEAKESSLVEAKPDEEAKQVKEIAELRKLIKKHQS